MWDDFVANLQYSERHFDTVIGQCKRYLIDPKIFHSNLFLLSGHRHFYPETGLLEPTESLQELIRFLPPAYTLTFAAAFPDVIIWYMNSYDDEAYSTNPYFVEIKNNTSKYFDEEGMPKYSFFMMIVIAYGKENPFECRINILPDNPNIEHESKIPQTLPLTTSSTQKVLDSLTITDPPFKRDDY